MAVYHEVSLPSVEIDLQCGLSLDSGPSIVFTESKYRHCNSNKHSCFTNNSSKCRKKTAPNELLSCHKKLVSLSVKYVRTPAAEEEGLNVKNYLVRTSPTRCPFINKLQTILEQSGECSDNSDGRHFDDAWHHVLPLECQNADTAHSDKIEMDLACQDHTLLHNERKKKGLGKIWKKLSTLWEKTVPFPADVLPVEAGESPSTYCPSMIPPDLPVFL